MFETLKLSRHKNTLILTNENNRHLIVACVITPGTDIGKIYQFKINIFSAITIFYFQYFVLL